MWDEMLVRADCFPIKECLFNCSGHVLDASKTIMLHLMLNAATCSPVLRSDGNPTAEDSFGKEVGK